ncbi:MAG: hypothetical protein RIR51_1017 [Bacteroidota bacterium]
MKNKQTNIKRDALEYHSQGRPGKIEVRSTKPTASQRDLSLAYSPGVAEPCLAIAQNPDTIYDYTAKGNLVAVISNGTAVLGLGNIGAAASKPVMEGKGVLFKIFADIDVFDLELDCKDIDEFVHTVAHLEPTFGGINLEDIKSPECFEIEEKLRNTLKIPVMHDDQHGTAIISSAALKNALEIVNKDISKVKFVVSGAGAAAISCMKLYIKMGAKLENFDIFDISGIISTHRKDLNKYLQPFAVSNKEGKTLVLAMKGADVFIGLSAGNILDEKMIQSMAKDPIVFAMANPSPEIEYNKAVAARKDIIMATGRSDFPNQVNNVLGFPFIFRGALDVRATEINDEMKLAAAHALADLAKKPVPDMVLKAYEGQELVFGRKYIIPKPVDPRLISQISMAVAKAAMNSKVAKMPIKDWDQYEFELSNRLGFDNQLMRFIINKAKSNPKRILFADSEDARVLKAARMVLDEKIAFPVLYGNEKKIKKIAEANHIDLEDFEIISTLSKEVENLKSEFAEIYYSKRYRSGSTLIRARSNMENPSYFTAMLLEQNKVDGLIGGLSKAYPDVIKPTFRILNKKSGVNKIAGMYLLLTKKGPLFFSDATINFNPSTSEIVEITELTVKAVKRFNIVPKIALVSYSNFGSSEGEEAKKMKDATSILKSKHPDWIVEGEMQAHIALNVDIRNKNYPFAQLENSSANTLIFPNLSAANIAYNLLKEVGEIEYIGPILLGLEKPAHILQLGSSVREIYNMTAISVVEAQE